VKVRIDLDNDVLPSSNSIRAIDDANKVVLDSRLETFHKAIDPHLLGHVEVRGEFKKMCKVVESQANLMKVIESLVSSESESRVGKLLLELRSKELPVQENRRFHRLEVTEPLDRNTVFKIETSKHILLVVGLETGRVELHDAMKLGQERSDLLMAPVEHARITNFDSASRRLLKIDQSRLMLSVKDFLNALLEALLDGVHLLNHSSKVRRWNNGWSIEYGDVSRRISSRSDRKSCSRRGRHIGSVASRVKSSWSNERPGSRNRHDGDK
jgi:hypothetical protein